MNDKSTYNINAINFDVIMNENEKEFSKIKLCKDESKTIEESEFNSKNKKQKKSGKNDLQNYVSLNEWLREQDRKKFESQTNPLAIDE